MDDQRLSESAWRRGTKDTLKLFHSVWFWLLDFVVAPVIGVNFCSEIYDVLRLSEPCRELFATIIVAFAVIGAAFAILTIAAPIRQRNEARRRLADMQNREQRLAFTSKIYRVDEKSGQCAAFRLSVKNDGLTTIRNVSVKIAEIYGETDAATKELQKYIGLPLCTTIDPSDGYRVPMEKPQHLVTLHQTETALFDVARVCVLPGNHKLLHAMYQRSSLAKQMEQAGASPIDQKPSGTIPPGKYTIVLSAVGEDVEPEKQKFEFSADENSVDFHKV